MILQMQLLGRCQRLELNMSDIYGIAKSGLQAQRILATTGQNIVNVGNGNQPDVK